MWLCVLLAIWIPFNYVAGESVPVLVEQKYFVAVPKVFVSGEYSSISISISNLKSDVEIQVLLKYQTEERKFTKVISAKSNYDDVLELLPLYIPSSFAGNVKLKVKATGGISFDKHISVTVKKIRNKMFIQTDKPLYKAGGKVKFRIVSIDKDLKPSSYMFADEIYITNAQGSRMMQWNNVSMNNGVVSLEMPLSVKPVLGEWKIHAKSDGIKAEQSIIVEKYVMPKFELTISSPPYIVKSDKEVTFEVCGRYTYGKKVTGSLNLNICIQKKSYLGKKCSSLSTKINGCKNIIYKIPNDYQNHVSNFELFGTLTEDGTQDKVNGSHKTVSVANKLKLNIDAPKHFKPKFQYEIKIHLTTPDGRPITTTQYVNLKIQKTNSLKGGKTQVIYKKLRIENGFQRYNFTPSEDVIKYFHSIHYSPSLQRGVAFSNTGIKKETVSDAWYSISDEFVKIISASNLEVDRLAQLVVKFSQKTLNVKKTLNMLLICRSKIQRVLRTKTSSIITTVYIFVEQEMVPTCRVLVYYINGQGEFISDSRVINFGLSFLNKASLSFSSEEKKPGEKVDMTMRADPGSLFFVSAVDRSILLMSSSNELKENQIFSILQDQDVKPTHISHIKRCRRSGLTRTMYLTVNDRRKDGRFATEEAGIEFISDAKLSVIPCKTLKVGIIKVIKKVFEWRWEPVPMRRFMTMQEKRGPSNPIPFMLQNKRVRPFKMSTQIMLQKKKVRVSKVSTKTKKQKKIVKSLKKPKVRKEFPESWLWLDESIDYTGQKTFSVKVPDAITTWHASAFAVSKLNGIGVTKATNLRVFQPFFVSMTLPYSVKRGEMVKIPVSVFNYLDECLIVDITLKETTDFIPLNQTIQSLCVCGSTSKTVKFAVKPITLGKINMRVDATTSTTSGSNNICEKNSILAFDVIAADALTKKVLVEAEGIKKEFSKSHFFCPQKKRGRRGVFVGNISLDVPENVVPGSVYTELVVTGDLLGPTLDGLDTLLAMPYGCGEQNMLKFAPNIYVMDYLKATKQVTSEIEKKAKEFMTSGYQRELTYKHDNGAYSAFGERDKEGSTWLSAFVLRSYAQARNHIYIDPKELEDTKNWLLSLQKSNGCFKEVGMVHHKELKGGVTSGVTMTAFVLIALLNADTPYDDERIKKSLICIDAKLKDVNDFYSAAVLAYALKLAGSSKANLMLEKLQKGAIRDGGMHWEDQPKKVKKPIIHWYYHQARSADIEMTAYALMAYIGGRQQFGSRLDRASIMKWLTKQRNSYGGFSSTQDTCVGLQALTQYSAVYYSPTFDLNIQTKYSSIKKNIRIHDNNKLVVQKYHIDAPLPLDIDIEATGKGCALVQANVKYNEKEPNEDIAFQLKVDVKQDKDSMTCLHKIKVCASYLDVGKSNMAIIDVNMVSGFEPIIHELDAALQSEGVTYNMYEFNDGVLSFYFDEFENTSKCVQFSMEQTSEVIGRKPASISVYDYYDKDNAARKMYVVGQCPEVNVVS